MLLNFSVIFKLLIEATECNNALLFIKLYGVSPEFKGNLVVNGVVNI